MKNVSTQTIVKLFSSTLRSGSTEHATAMSVSPPVCMFLALSDTSRQPINISYAIRANNVHDSPVFDGLIGALQIRVVFVFWIFSHENRDPRPKVTACNSSAQPPAARMSKWYTALEYRARHCLAAKEMRDEDNSRRHVTWYCG